MWIARKILQKCYSNHHPLSSSCNSCHVKKELERRRKRKVISHILRRWGARLEYESKVPWLTESQQLFHFIPHILFKVSHKIHFLMNPTQLHPTFRLIKFLSNTFRSFPTIFDGLWSMFCRLLVLVWLLFSLDLSLDYYMHSLFPLFYARSISIVGFYYDCGTSEVELNFRE